MERIRIYGDSTSGNCHKVGFTAKYLGLESEWVEVDILDGGTATAEFLALNPFGQVPVVELADGQTLTQSNAIVLFLAEGSSLIPTLPLDRARMHAWMFWEQYSHEPCVAVTRSAVIYKGIDIADRDPVLVAKAERALRHMNQSLDNRAYLVGDRLTAADIALLAYTRLAPEGGFDMDAYPAVKSWISRVERDLAVPQTF